MGYYGLQDRNATSTTKLVEEIWRKDDRFPTSRYVGHVSQNDWAAFMTEPPNLWKGSKQEELVNLCLKWSKSDGRDRLKKGSILFHDGQMLLWQRKFGASVAKSLISSLWPNHDRPTSFDITSQSSVEGMRQEVQAGISSWLAYDITLEMSILLGSRDQPEAFFYKEGLHQDKSGNCQSAFFWISSDHDSAICHIWNWRPHERYSFINRH